MSATTGNDTLSGTTGNDTIDALAGNDLINGDLGDDSLIGNDGGDTINGGAGNDTLDGGNGDDWLYGGAGNDVVMGGDGYDRANYRNAAGSVVIDMTSGIVTDGDGGTDTLSGIERVMGSEFNDTITGSSAADDFTGNQGDDVLNGGDGFDFVWYGNATSAINVDLATGLVTGGEGNDTLSSIEGVAGSGFGDTLTGSSADEYFRGEGGSDTIDGKGGFDIVDYRDDPGGVSIDLQAGTAIDGYGATDTLVSIEEARGSSLNDTILGTSGSGGSQFLHFERFEGRGGNDTIDGGVISDTLNQKDGNQASYTRATAAVVVDLQSGGINNGSASGGAGNDVLLNINEVRGSDFNDTILGSNRTDVTEVFEGRGGNDSIDGRGGFDIVRFDGASSGVTASLVSGTSSGGGGNDTFANIEGLWGSSFGDSLTGGNAANGTKVSDPQSEFFLGGAGNDTIDGGQGYDLASYQNSTTGVVATLNDSADGSASDGWGGTDVLRNIEGLRGSAYNDTLTGSDSAAFESFEGREGDDVIDGKGNVDRVDYFRATSGVNVNLVTGVAADGYGGTDSLANIENVRGSRDFNDTIVGDSGANKLEGLGGDDSISAGAGNDTIVAGSGVDTVDGGLGTDRLVLQGAFADDYNAEIVNTNTIHIWNTVTKEDITASNIEWIQDSKGEGVSIWEVRSNLQQHNTNTAPVFANAPPGTWLSNDYSAPDTAGRIAKHADGSFSVFGAYGTGYGAGAVELWKINSDGTLDLNYGGDGRALSTALGTNFTTRDMVVDANDKVVIAGWAVKNDGTFQLGLQRFDTDGTLDTGFGTGGTVVSSFAVDDRVRSIALQSTGKIIAVGQTQSGSTQASRDFLLVRYDENGSIDPTFGTGGKTVLSLSATTSDIITAVQVLADNSILAWGTQQDPGTGATSVVLARFTADGSLDTTFGTNNSGYTLTPLANGSINVAARSLAVQGDGKIVALGMEPNGFGGQGLFVERFNSNGSIDTAFGADGNTDGKVSIAIGSASDLGWKILVQPDGKILIDSDSQNSDTQLGAIIRLNTDGSLDTTFGDAGVARSPFEMPGFSGFNDIVLDAGGNIVAVAGVAPLTQADVADAAVIRYTSAGVVDTTFNVQDSLAGKVLAGAGGPAVDMLFQGAAVFDAELAAIDNYNGATLTVQRHGGAVSSDVFLPDSDTSFADGTVTLGGKTIGTVSNANGVLSITFNNNASQMYVNGVMSQIMWQNASVSAGITVQFDWTLNDGDPSGAQSTTGISSITVVTQTVGTTGDASDNVIYGTPGNDTISGGAGDDFIAGDLGNDSLSGGDGNDSMVGNGGADTIIGGKGNDILDGGDVNDRINYSDGNWLSYADATSGIVMDLSGIWGDGRMGHGVVHDGQGGTDLVSNFPFIIGSDHDDWILGSTALGFEMFYGGLGNDTIDGGAIDSAGIASNRVTYQFLTGSTGVSVNLATNGINSGTATGGAGNDVLLNINHVRGTDFDDTLIGSDRTDIGETFDGRKGNDSIDGKGGFDTIRFDAGGMTTGVVASLATGIVSNDGFGTTDTISGIEGLFGSSGNDSLTGGNAASDGLEQFRGGAGDDTLDGGSGNDRADYGSSTSGANILLNDTTDGSASDGLGGTDVLRSIEYITGSAFNDTIAGNSANNSLDGSGGNDSISAGAGNDTVIGGSGDDTLVGNTGNDSMTGGSGNDSIVGNEGADSLRGGSGNDTMDGGAVTDRINYTDGNTLTYSDATAGIAMNLSGITGDGESGSGTVQDGYGNTDTVSRVQFITGSDFNDSILGSSAKVFEQFEGRGGNDTIDGGVITDTLNGTNNNRVNYTAATGAVSVDLGAGTASGAAGNDTLVHINALRGSNFGDTLTGSSTTTFTEFFDGRAGNDTIDGKGGFDILRYDSASTTGVNVNLVNGTATDGQGGTDTFTNIEGVYGSNFDDTLTGGNAANGVTLSDGLTEVFRGGAGNDAIDGGQGYDRVDFTASTSGVTVTLGGTGTGSVADDGQGGHDTLVGIEGVRGSEFADVLTGSDSGAFESFEGKAGADVIDGKGGTDRADYRTSTSGVNVDLAGGTAQDGWGFTDSLANIENVRGSRDANDTIGGSAVANFLEGLGGNDSITGLAGNDTLDAGTGTDTVDGGTDTDTVVLHGNFSTYSVTISGSDLRLVSGSTGEDVTVRNVESFQFSDGTKSFAQVQAVAGNDQGLNGDGGNNSLVGGAGNDNISGNDGNDTLVGNDGDDFLTGGRGNDSLVGGNGWDTANYNDGTATAGVTVNLNTGLVTGGAGADTLSGIEAVQGSANADNITGSNGDNYIAGNGGNDTISGLDGNDWIDGGAGNDSIAGGTNGWDTADYASATNSVVVNLATGAVTGGAGTDTLSGIENVNGSNFADTITGSTGDNWIRAGLGNDSLVGGAGWDTASYNAATGSVVVNLGTGVATGADGTDTLSGFESVEASDFDDTIVGDGSNNSLNPGRGNDYVDGGAGNGDMVSYWSASGGVNIDLSANLVTGAAGTDTLAGIENAGGSNFDDTITGSSGDNYIDGNFGADLIDGGSGWDTVSYSFAVAPVSVNLATGAVSGSENDTLAGIEAVTGSNFNDTLVGDGNNNAFTGGLGNDSIDGAGGTGDSANYWDATAGVNANLATGAVTGASGNDTLVGIENLGGSASNDTLTGDANGNFINGGAGNDTIDGGGGNDNLQGGAGNDSIAGGSGFDTANYGDIAAGITVTLNGGAATVTGGGGTDTLSGVEAVFGSQGNDSITGDAANNNIDGNSGNDTLDGGDGNDSMFGSAGDDLVRGGKGSDFIRGNQGNDTLDGGVLTERVNYSDGNTLNYGDATTGIVMNLSGITGDGTAGTGSVQDGRGGVDTVSNFQFYTGSAFNDSIVGSTARQFEMFEGVGGDDTIDGGAITDTLNLTNSNRANYGNSSGSVTVDLSVGEDGWQHASGAAGNDLLKNFNQVRGSAFADTLLGSDSTITESFEGRGGDDFIDGKGGFDIVRYDTSTAGVNVNLVDGTATGDLGNDTFINIEGVFGGKGNDTLIGGNTANGVTVGDGKSEIFRGGGGNDYIDGGDGYDRVDYNMNDTMSGNTGVNVTLGGTGTGTAIDGLGGTDELHNIEAVRGSDLGDTLTGSDSGEFESFEGLAGADRIDGRGGYDRVDYSRSTAGVNVNLTSTDTVSGGTAVDGWGFNDTLFGIEGVRGSVFNDTITGSSKGNRLEGQGGNDSIAAGDGDDTIYAGTGVDTVDGGLGTNDTLVLLGAYGDGKAYAVTRPNSSDTVLTNSVTGETITFRGVENFAFTDGSKTLADLWGNALDGFDNVYSGNELDNVIDGLAGNDSLSGLGGNDTIIGGLGNDTLVGGQGDDVFSVDNPNDVIVENADEGTDLVNVQFTTAGIFDMSVKADNVENANVLGSVAAGVTGNALDNLIVGNAGGNSLSGGDGNDTLDGGAGSDTLVGGNGNDTYVIDVTTDVINETLNGGGYDTVVVKFASGTYTLGAGIDDATVDSAAGAAGLIGNALSNGLSGNDLANSISGGDGNDEIAGNGGNDTLLGGNGGDFLEGDAGNDSIDGGVVTDRANYRDGNAIGYDGATTGVVVNLSGIIGDGTVGSGSVQDGLNGVDTVKNVTYVFGSQNNDTITGSSANVWESFDGLGGDDVIDGGAITNYFVNSNRVSYSNATVGVLVDLGANGIGSGTATGQGNDTLLNINQVRGSFFNDTLYGSDRIDMPEVFEGRQGSNTIDGKGGFDYVSYLAIKSKDGIHGVTVDLAAGTGGNADDWTDTFTNVEGVFGSHYDDTLLGGSDAPTEVFRGNGGWDYIDGGSGTDMVDYGSSDKGIVLSLATGKAQDGWFYTPTQQGTDTLVNIEGVRGSEFADSITGSSAWFEFFQGRGGNDTIDGGGGGGDRVEYTSSTAAVNVNLSTGIATDGLGGTDTLKNISDVLGSRFNDTIVGTAFIDYLMGWQGNDSISAGDGDDTVEAGTASGAGDTVDGGLGADTLVLLGEWGDGTNYGISRPNATDTVLTRLSTGETVTVRGVESFEFTDATKTIADLWSNAVSPFDDVYSGGAGNDLIDGLGGNDSLSGLAGNDTIIGGAGNDTLVGGLGDDVYTVDNPADLIVENADEGTDSVNVQFLIAGSFDMGAKAANVENAVVTGTVAAGVTGNALDNQITGNAGANSLSGGAGNDTLVGGAGSDTLVGGTGDDTYVIDVSTDVVNETLNGGGTDTVQLMFAAAGSYTMTGGVENAVIGNGTAVTINGNELNNTITGNAANNILNGGLGNDTLVGGTATGTGDTLDGGAGAGDTVNMIAASNAWTKFRLTATDTRVTTTSGEIVVLRNVEYVHFSDDVTLNMGQIWGNDPTELPDWLEGTSGNDTIDGKGGNDTIYGNEGNDTLQGGLGIDSLVGGVGNDTFIVDVAGDVVVENADEGTDSITVSFVASGTYNMLTNAKNVENATAFGAPTPIAMNIVGNELANVLTGNNAANSLTGGDGNDTLIGNGGTDTLVGGAGDDLYVIDATTDIVNDSVGGSGTNDTVRLVLAGAATYTLTSGVENGIVFNSTSGVNITGNASANMLTGNAGNNILNGAAGNDTIISSGGTDVVDGGTESDTLVLAGNLTDYIVTRPTTASTVFSKLGTQVTVSNVEYVQFDTGLPVDINLITADIGSPGNDTLNGSPDNDTLDGAVGNDTVYGFGGDDTLWGGTGADSIIGGTGTDIMDGGDGSDAYFWSPGDGDDIITQNDTVSTDIDVLQIGGGITKDQVSFSRGGFTYNDLVVTIQQGDGDTATFDNITVTDFFNNDSVSLGAIDQVQVLSAPTLPFTQAAIKAAVLANGGSGNGNDVFVGFESNDSLPGSANDDWILAGAGNDTIGASDGNDIAFGGLGADSLSGGNGNDLLVGGAGNDTIAGGAGDDSLSGGAGSDLYVFASGGGHDTISESLFALSDDQLESGLGPVYAITDGDTPLGSDTDTLQFQAGIAEADVRATRSGNDLVLLVGGGDDSVTVSNYFANGVATIERVQFSSGVIWSATQIRAKVLVPTSGDDQITGYLSNDKLYGGAGNDTIDGREGSDTITGGAGDDLLTGGGGNDRFVLDNADGIDTITDFVTGVDTIALSNAVFGGLGAVGSRIGLSANLTYNAGTGELSYDSDGAGTNAPVVIAIIGTTTHPGALGSDFVIVT